MKTRERILLAGLLDKLEKALKTSDELQELSTDEIARNRREVESCINKISLCLAETFQIRTPIGEQRAISGVAK